MRIDLSQIEDEDLVVGLAPKALSIHPWLGGLAAWVFSDTALQAVGLQPPLPPDTAGSVTALFVWQAGCGSRLVSEGIFAPCFGLPLIWRCNNTDSFRLPPDVARIATQIRQALADGGGPRGNHGQKCWGLDLHPCLGDIDLGSLEVSADSAFAPLAAGLCLAMQGGRLDPAVLSTGAWQGDGIRGVQGIEAKTEAAARIGGRSARLFVPAANFDAARAAVPDRIGVLAFEAGQPDLLRSLQPLLAELAVPPVASQPLAERLHWANLDFVIRAVGRKRQKYYLDCLVSDLAKQLAGQVALPRIDRLALSVSHQWEVALLLALALQPRELLLLCTQQTLKATGEIRRCLARPEEEIRKDVVISEDGVQKEKCSLITAWLKGGVTAAAEITGGTKEMTALLLVAARQAGAKVLYLRHQTGALPPFAPLYGTESIVRLEWTERDETC